MNVRTLHYSESGSFSGSIGRELDSAHTHDSGELCPQNGASCCELHNQTMTITTISERS
jgi:hypothetical protein